MSGRHLAFAGLCIALIGDPSFAAAPRFVPSDAVLKNPPASQSRLLPGIYRASVISSSDPAGQHRLQVNIPAVGRSGVWALPCRPYLADGPLPPPGDVVWVAFEGGDVNVPVWLGVPH